VHGFSGRAAGDGGELDVRGAPHALIAAVPKMLFPFLVIVPGMIAIALTHHSATSGFALPLKTDGSFNYDLAMPMLLVHYFPHGLLGLGITALFASFMSGMAGNVSAFNTVWTYDIYQAYIRSGASDHHYLNMGRIATVVGVCLSVAAAYVANRFNNIMDMLQLLFAFVNAPLFATFLLGMFWKRATATAHSSACSAVAWPQPCIMGSPCRARRQSA
jgi:SSS family solute:Na+ symporter